METIISPDYHPLMHTHTELCKTMGGCDIVEHGLEGWGRHEDLLLRDQWRFWLIKDSMSFLRKQDFRAALKFRSLVVAEGMWVNLHSWYGDVWAKVLGGFRWNCDNDFHPDWDSVYYEGRDGKREMTHISYVRDITCRPPSGFRIFAK